MLHELKTSLAQYFNLGTPKGTEAPVKLREARLPQFGRTVSIVADDVRAPFIVKNISQTGISGHVEVLPEVGAVVRIQFEDGCGAIGTVKWVRGSSLGIGFETPLPLDVVEWDGAERSETPRPPRFSICQPVTLRAAEQSARATVVNVSRGGMRLVTCLSTIPGQRVWIDLVGFPPLYGRVRWTKLDAVGVMFDEDISLRDFDTAIRHLPPGVGTARSAVSAR